jgi:GT2 family glycosyltransferase
MRKPKVAIVVLNYKGWRDSIKCVQSLLKQTYASFHIVLIENGSHDKSAQKLSTLKDRKLTYIEESINHGFTGGVNIGIRWAIDRGYDCVALFNNDAQAETDWLENLVNAMSRTKASIVTGLLLSENGKKIDDAGDMWHANPTYFNEDWVNPISKLTAKEIWDKEINKEQVAIDHGYALLRIWESDYKKNKEKVIKECISFLTQ